jgi:hypothetical protein
MVGFTLSRRLAPAPLALPIAPPLGWAFHSALALPLYRIIGFTPWTVSIGSLTILAAAFLIALPIRIEEPNSTVRVPPWAYGLAAVLAALPAIALFPKFSPEGVALAAPIFDHSKVAIIDEMTRLGLPPGNPFFGEAGDGTSLAYYYLWHFSAAELVLLFGGGGWDGDIAMTAVTAFSSLTLMMGFAVWIGGRAAAAIWVVPLAFAAALYPALNAVFGRAALYSVIQEPTGFAGWLFQTTWAPQHISSTSCVLLSSFLLVQLARRPTWPTLLVLALTTVAGYESSTWVGGILFAAASPVLGAVLLVTMPAQNRLRFVICSVGAALVAALLAYPFMRDQFFNAAARGGGSPIILYPVQVFQTDAIEQFRWLLDVPGYWLVLLVVEFPAIYLPGVASLIAMLRSKLDPAQDTLARTLCALAVVSLLIAGLFTITFAENNDLGWRAVLPAVCILTIFAAIGLSRWLTAPAPLAAAGALLLLLLGLPRSFELAAEDFHGALTASGKSFAATPAMWDAVRQHTAPDERVANNPLFMRDLTPWPVNLPWALFADRPSCFAGRELALPYTSLPRTRLAEIENQFVRVFGGHEQPGDVRDLATRYQCRTVVVTSQDGAWNNDPFAASPYYKRVDELVDQWRIYRAIEPHDDAATPDHP